MGGSFVSGSLQRAKLFLGQPALEKKNAVHMTMGPVVVVNCGDELKVSAELFLKFEESLPGDVLQIQIFVGIFFDRIGAYHDLKKGSPLLGAINHLVGCLFIRETISAKKQTGDFFLGLPSAMGDIAKMRLNLLLSSDIFEPHYCHS
jgi:hypothetical protein